MTTTAPTPSRPRPGAARVARAARGRVRTRDAARGLAGDATPLRAAVPYTVPVMTGGQRRRFRRPGAAVARGRALLPAVVAPGAARGDGGRDGPQHRRAAVGRVRPDRVVPVLRGPDAAAQPGLPPARGAGGDGGHQGPLRALAGGAAHPGGDAAPGLPPALRRVAGGRGPGRGDAPVVRRARGARVLPQGRRRVPQPHVAPPRAVQGGQPGLLLRPLRVRGLRLRGPAGRRPRPGAGLPAGGGAALRRPRGGLRRRPQRLRRQRRRVLGGAGPPVRRGGPARAAAGGLRRRLRAAVHRQPLRRAHPRPAPGRGPRAGAGGGPLDHDAALRRRLAGGLRPGRHRPRGRPGHPGRLPDPGVPVEPEPGQPPPDGDPAVLVAPPAAPEGALRLLPAVVRRPRGVDAGGVRPPRAGPGHRRALGERQPPGVLPPLRDPAPGHPDRRRSGCAGRGGPAPTTPRC